MTRRRAAVSAVDWQDRVRNLPLWRMQHESVAQKLAAGAFRVFWWWAPLVSALPPGAGSSFKSHAQLPGENCLPGYN